MKVKILFLAQMILILVGLLSVRLVLARNNSETVYIDEITQKVVESSENYQNLGSSGGKLPGGGGGDDAGEGEGSSDSDALDDFKSDTIEECFNAVTDDITSNLSSSDAASCQDYTQCVGAEFNETTSAVPERDKVNCAKNYLCNAESQAYSNAQDVLIQAMQNAAGSNANSAKESVSSSARASLEQATTNYCSCMSQFDFNPKFIGASCN